MPLLQSKAARANIYVGNELFAEDAPDPYRTSTSTATLLRIGDQLGTLRARWDIGSNWVGACSSLPYGNYTICTAGTSFGLPINDMLFTGKQRDNESDLNYFGARYYNSTRGRWMSPDWSSKADAVPYSDLKNPQTLNLYGYVQNDPLTHADADGHCWPACTALLGAALGAIAEAGSESLQGEHLNPYKIGAAAAAGAVTGAIAGPIGDAAELGLVAKVGGQLAANLVGGAVERGLNGEKAIDGKAATADALGAAASGKAEDILGKQLASKAVEKVSGAAIDVTFDAGKNLITAKPEVVKPSAPQSTPTHKSCAISSECY
jgi:RHS repeat-associated protein